MSRKQQLLKRHRRNKRIGLLVGLLVLIVSGVWLAWWLPPVLAVLGGVAHEAWFADHLFYSPQDDYQYAFDPDGECLDVRLEGERLVLDQPLSVTGNHTLILAIRSAAAGWGVSLTRAFNCWVANSPISKPSSVESTGCAM